MDDIFVRLGVALLIGDIPPECFKERIEKFPTQLSFVVTLALIGFAVLLEAFDEGGNDRGRFTHNRQSLFISVWGRCRIPLSLREITQTSGAIPTEGMVRKDSGWTGDRLKAEGL